MSQRENGPEVAAALRALRALDELPLYATRDASIFPHDVRELPEGRPANHVALTRALDAKPSLLALVSQRDPRVDEPGYDDLHLVGCAVEIVEVNRVIPHNPFYDVLGVARIRVRWLQRRDAGLWRAVGIEVIDDRSPALANLAEPTSRLRRIAGDLVERFGFFQTPPLDLTDPGQLADVIATCLRFNVEPEVVQRALELEDVAARVAYVIEVVEGQLARRP